MTWYRVTLPSGATTDTTGTVLARYRALYSKPLGPYRILGADEASETRDWHEAAKAQGNEDAK